MLCNRMMVHCIHILYMRVHVYNTNEDNKHTCAAWKRRKQDQKKREMGKNTVKMSMSSMRSFVMNYGLCTLQYNEKFNIC